MKPNRPSRLQIWLMRAWNIHFYKNASILPPGRTDFLLTTCDSEIELYRGPDRTYLKDTKTLIAYVDDIGDSKHYVKLIRLESLPSYSRLDYIADY